MSGVVVVQSKGELAHQGLTLTMEGSVNLQLSAKSVGVFEAFYNSLKVGILFENSHYSTVHVQFAKFALPRKQNACID